jgi:hypothetical protein
MTQFPLEEKKIYIDKVGMVHNLLLKVRLFPKITSNSAKFVLSNHKQWCNALKFGIYQFGMVTGIPI